MPNRHINRLFRMRETFHIGEGLDECNAFQIIISYIKSVGYRVSFVPEWMERSEEGVVMHSFSSANCSHYDILKASRFSSKVMQRIDASIMSDVNAWLVSKHLGWVALYGYEEVE